MYVIHRLDRDTSGIVMFAKSDELRKAYQDNWDRLVKKRRYAAVCEGVPSPAEDTITSYLRESTSHMVYTAEKSRFSKEAVTHYKTVKSREALFPSRHRNHDRAQKPDQSAACRTRESDRRRQKIRCRNKSDTPPRASCV